MEKLCDKIKSQLNVDLLALLIRDMNAYEFLAVEVRDTELIYSYFLALFVVCIHVQRSLVNNLHLKSCLTDFLH